MKVSELITYLKVLYNEEGDVDCYMLSDVPMKPNVSVDINFVNVTYAFGDHDNSDITIAHLKKYEK